ncbi:MAG: hypothetical protein JO257_25290 [Deltaproteobacteria bacterium]|nr:hypothetical protein [Deltaproteobacteria bacterium]
MRHALVLLLVATPAFADSFGGFSGVDRPYLVSPDRVCTPLEVKDKVATGAPSCDKGTTEAIAHLDIKAPARGELKASTSGTKLTVVNKAGDTLVTWTAPDPIGKVVDVFVSKYEDRVAVVYTTRRLGKEVTDVVAFELVKTTGRTQPVPKPADPTTTQPVVQAPPEDPKVTKAVESARKIKTKAAWQAVLAIDPDNSEARYRLAALAGKAGTPDLQTLAKSKRPDAIEWLVEARFDPAFAALRADKAFRDAVGLDRAPATMYEHVMGFGGQWEQTGTSCDKAEVHLVLQRDRSFKLRVKTTCEGQGYDLPFKGTWRVAADGIVLSLPPAKGKAASAKDEAPCTLAKAGEEDSLHCDLGNDIDFTVLPTRR